MAKTIDLCTPCAEIMKAGYTVKVVKRSINNKVTCGHCNRRRYGATYELTPARKTEVRVKQ